MNALAVLAAGALAFSPVAPPVQVGPPAGDRPGQAAGLRGPQRCDPPPAGPSDSGVAARLRLPEAHRFATGRGQLVAVIDTGVAEHPLLAGRLLGGGDYLEGGNGLVDCDGHGTAVAGIVAGAAEPRTDGRAPEPVGIAPEARILAIRQSSPSFTVPGPDGARPAGDTATLAEAVVLAVRGGAGVVNISEAACLTPERAASAGASLQAALRLAVEADVVVVAAAGNLGPACAGPAAGEVSLPGWYEDLLTVAAVGSDDSPTEFTVPGAWVDVAAPGTGLRSLAVDGGTTAAQVEGTSFAAPWVAGLAALVRQRFPALTAQQVRERIVATARRPAGGRNDLIGAGVIDPVAALTAVPAVLPPPAATPSPSTPLPPRSAHPDAPPGIGSAELVAAGALLAAAVGAAALLRRRRDQDGP